MASVKLKFSVGIFVITGIVISVFGVIWLGMSNYLGTGQLYVSYFDESVQGLDEDSPVKYRGVSVGRVHDIRMAPDENLIQVILKIESGLKHRQSMDHLVAQLKSVGITGLMFIEIDRRKKEDIPLTPEITFETGYPIIPTKSSGVKKFVEGFDIAVEKLKAMDLKTASDTLTSTLLKLDKVLDELEIKKLSSDIQMVLGEAKKILDSEKYHKILDSVDHAANTFNKMAKTADKTAANIYKTSYSLDDMIKNLDTQINQSVSEFNNTIVLLNQILKNGDYLISHSDVAVTNLQAHLMESIKNLKRSSEALTRFLELITEHPSKLILANPPPEKMIQ